MTTHMKAGAKYCNEYVCVCVCLSTRISPEPHGQYLPNFLQMLLMDMTRPSDGRVTKSQMQWAILGVFFPTDNALCSIAFGTHTKTAEPIELPFGLMSRLSRGTVCYVGVTIPEVEGAILGETY